MRPVETIDRRSGLTRRDLLANASWMGIGLLGVSARAEPARSATPTPLLETSPFVYISPLKRDGSESTCHGELWYAWLDGTIVVTVASDRWKATALARGLPLARIWVGGHGRWKTWYGGRNEAFRKAPSFDARVEKVGDTALLDRLLSTYEQKYPDEIATWRDLMREGNADGSRILLRYTPLTN